MSWASSSKSTKSPALMDTGRPLRMNALSSEPSADEKESQTESLSSLDIFDAVLGQRGLIVGPLDNQLECEVRSMLRAKTH